MEEFKNVLKSNYLFHFHTTYTDGKSTVKDYFDFAFRHNIDTLIFTEHVRKKLSYNFDYFLEDIERERFLHPTINVFVGVEAKLLPGGELDIPEKILGKIQLIGFACHSFPDNVQLYQKSFEKLFLDSTWKAYIRVWLHPGRFLKKRKLLKTHIEVLKRLAKFAEKEGVFIENNLKEQLPPPDVISFCDKQKIILGFDAHCVEEVVQLEGEAFRKSRRLL